MEQYVDLKTLNSLSKNHYKRYKERVSFDYIVREAITKGLCVSTAPTLIARTTKVMDADELMSLMGSFKIATEAIIQNKNKKMISEGKIIPQKCDVETVWHQPYIDDGMHGHDHFEIDYVYTGQARLELSDKRMMLRQGTLFIIAPDVEHNLLVDDDSSLIIGIVVRKSTFDIVFQDVLMQDDLFARYLRNILYQENQNHCIQFFVGAGNTLFEKLIQDIIIETHNETRYSNVFSNCFVQQMFFTLLRDYGSTVKHYSESNIEEFNIDFPLILEYTQKHYDTVSLEFLSQFFNYSQSHISRMFKKYLNMSFKSIQNNLRMKKAEELLICTSKRISDISDEIGLASTDYFTRAFKKKNKMTPTEYRKRMGREVRKIG